MTIQLAVFDLAGTTVNDPDGVCNCLRAALSAVGVESSREQVNLVMGIPKPDAIRRLIQQANREDLLDQIMSIHSDFSERMIQFYETSDEVYEIPGTSEVFRSLHEMGVKVAVNTGFDRRITQALLDRLGWESDGLIDASITSDEVENGRPAADMIQSLMKQLGIDDSKNVAKIGDTPADLLEGVNAKCGLIIGVTEGSHTEAQLKEHEHHHLIANVTGAPSLISSS